MRNATRCKVLLACSACFLVGWLLAGGGPRGTLADQTPPNKVDAVPFPMTARLGANIYLQTTAEYRACCLGIYQGAAQRLEAALEKDRPKPEKPAVVMDLDETVLDNSAFQTFLYQNGLEYTDDLWADYEKNYPQDVTLIPGAKDFIKQARQMGTAVVFISNRSEANRKSTESALERNGVDLSRFPGCLYLRPACGTADKSARREAVASKYNVLMYFGDNLRDFSESFKAPKLPDNPTTEDHLQAIKQRASSADDASCHWGVDWFVIPNPVYGEWEKLIGPDPLAILHPTSMKPKAPVPK